jgi:hypothetical protein
VGAWLKGGWHVVVGARANGGAGGWHPQQIKQARSGGRRCDGSNAMSRPNVLVARGVFPEVLARLAGHFEVDANPDDHVFSASELSDRLNGKDGAFITGSERIDAAVLDAHPRLRAVCNMAVGYNNIDLEACTARGVLVSNTPDVLTETTADFGFALMMATARRMAESEHFLRRGEWSRWSYDIRRCDVHGATWACWAWAASARPSPAAPRWASACRCSITTAAGSMPTSSSSWARSGSARISCCSVPTIW